jgi:hypothetical protein
MAVITFSIISPEELKKVRRKNLEHLALKITDEFCCCRFIS